MLKSTLLLLLLTSTCCECKANASTQLTNVVTLKTGQIRGSLLEVYTSTKDHHKVEFYQAIKYGEAARFAKPTPAKAWTGVYNATSAGNNCVQFGGGELIQNVTSTEDCLFVNVWKPVVGHGSGSSFSSTSTSSTSSSSTTTTKTTTKATTTKTTTKAATTVKTTTAKTTAATTTTTPPPSTSLLPVMVWIYGGAFESGGTFGNPPFYDGRYIAALGGVIVVSFNYRLGPLGFLTDGGKTVPPNLGFHDQILALKWVQENIHAFGGDPKLVTIFGESAGAIAVGSLVLSPLAKDLFKRAIAQSGAPLSVVVDTKEQALEKTKIFAKKVNCTVGADLVKCLKGKPIADLKKATFWDFSQNHFFVPVHGDEVLPVPPAIALKAGKINHVDFIYGTNRDEGTFFVPQFFPELASTGVRLTSNSTKAYITKLMTLFQRGSIAKEVADFYVDRLKAHPIQDQLRLAIASAFGDMLLVCPSVFFGEELARRSADSKVYAYRLMQSTPEAFLPGLPPLPAWIGIPHGADLFYFFQYDKTVQFDEENTFARYMIASWTNFARTGVPNGNWSEAVQRSRGDFSTRHLSLQLDHFKMVDGAFKDNCERFWKAKILG